MRPDDDDVRRAPGPRGNARVDAGRPSGTEGSSGPPAAKRRKRATRQPGGGTPQEKAGRRNVTGPAREREAGKSPGDRQRKHESSQRGGQQPVHRTPKRTRGKSVGASRPKP
jgi:hypothetical protein